MRRLGHAALVVAGLVAVAGSGVAPVGAADEPAGRWIAHFREDGFGRPGTDACEVDGSGAKTTCLPPGASQVVLPDGRILYWSAIEGSWSPK